MSKRTRCANTFYTNATEEEPTKTTSTTKRCKPSHAPRQPDTPYACFWKHERPLVLAAFPTMSAPNVSREVGSRWKKLSDQERQKWNNLASRDRQRYQQEMTVYRRLLSTPSTYEPTAEVTDVLMPAPPQSAFQCFLTHYRESLTLLNMTADEFHREMNTLWQRMTNDEKQVWIEQAADDLERFETEMAMHRRSCHPNHSTKRLQDLTTVARKMDNGPGLPQTAFDFFSTVKRRELLIADPSMTADDVLREIRKAWMATSTYDRLPFIGDEQRDVDRFVREMEALVAVDSVVDDTASQQPTPQPPCRLARKAKMMAPKKPMTAYNMMYLAKREELMRLYQLSQNECSALCGRMWRQMAELERQQYNRMADQDKQRYLREMELYLLNKGDSGGTAREQTHGDTSKDPT